MEESDSISSGRPGLGGSLGPSNIYGAAWHLGPLMDPTHPGLEFLFQGGKDPAWTPLFWKHFLNQVAPSWLNLCFLLLAYCEK